MSFQVKSRLYLGLIGVKWSQYATYFHLGPIQGLYEEDMLVIYHDFEGNLPFTGILQEVYRLPYATSTENFFKTSLLLSCADSLETSKEIAIFPAIAPTFWQQIPGEWASRSRERICLEFVPS